MSKIIIIVISLLFTTLTYAAPIVDINKIAGKTKNKVSKYLGKPTSCKKNKYGKKCNYKKGETEIVFINGKADWITIEGIDSIPFSPSALKALGLKTTKPSFKNNFSLKWSSINGLREVTIFKGSSKSDYVYIKVKTK